MKISARHIAANGLWHVKAEYDAFEFFTDSVEGFGLTGQPGSVWLDGEMSVEELRSRQTAYEIADRASYKKNVSDPQVSAKSIEAMMDQAD